MLFLIPYIAYIAPILAAACSLLPAGEAAASTQYQGRSKQIDKEVWKLVHPHLLPWDHPIRKKLDKVFMRSRATLSPQSMRKAGFSHYKPRHFTRLVVTSHPELPGYILKLYLDAQSHHHGKEEYEHWLERIKGAHLIEGVIKKNLWTHLFKVPKKWIYPLPAKPSPPRGYPAKKFIIVEENMEIYSDAINEKIWGSDAVNKEILSALHTIFTELGLRDCAKPANIPFAKDGKIAFIDTQFFHEDTVRYKRLTPFLSKKLRPYWKNLFQ